MNFKTAVLKYCAGTSAVIVRTGTYSTTLRLYYEYACHILRCVCVCRLQTAANEVAAPSEWEGFGKESANLVLQFKSWSS